MISMMINSASHNAPRHLTTTAETDQQGWNAGGRAQCASTKEKEEQA